jgi:hypothetical protein
MQSQLASPDLRLHCHVCEQQRLSKRQLVQARGASSSACLRSRPGVFFFVFFFFFVVVVVVERSLLVRAFPSCFATLSVLLRTLSLDHAHLGSLLHPDRVPIPNSRLRTQPIFLLTFNKHVLKFLAALAPAPPLLAPPPPRRLFDRSSFRGLRTLVMIPDGRPATVHFDAWGVVIARAT